MTLYHFKGIRELTHWGRATHIWVSKLTIIGSNNGLSPGRCQAIIWTNVGILLIRTSRTNFTEILSKIHTFSFKKMHLKISSAKWRQFCLGLNVLTPRPFEGSTNMPIHARHKFQIHFPLETKWYYYYSQSVVVLVMSVMKFCVILLLSFPISLQSIHQWGLTAVKFLTYLKNSRPKF